MKVIINVGLPRSGKSTAIKQYINGDTVVVCPDRIRKVIFGHQFHAPVEGFVWSTAYGMARLLLEQNKDIVIDATNLTYGERRRWYDIALEFDATIELFVMTTPYEVCVARNKVCPDDERVPESVLVYMQGRFENPISEEGVVGECIKQTIFTNDVYTIVEVDKDFIRGMGQ